MNTTISIHLYIPSAVTIVRGAHGKFYIGACFCFILWVQMFTYMAVFLRVN